MNILFCLLPIEQQNKALQTYRNHQLSLTSMVCFVGTLQAIAVTFVMEHKPSVWKIGFDMNLLAAAYAVCFSLSISLSLSLIITLTCLFLFQFLKGYCRIKHFILCARDSDEDKRACICNCFQPFDDDHCSNHGLLHLGRTNISWKVIFCSHQPFLASMHALSCMHLQDTSW